MVPRDGDDRGPEMSSESILVVCSANVCRSPLAELLLKQGLSDQQIRVESAGTHAQAGAEICPLVAVHQTDPAWGGAAKGCRSRLVTEELLAESDLVLTAARDIRGEVVRLHPEIRDHVFTFREAVLLGAGFAVSGRRSDRVRAYAEFLDQSRPTIVLPLPERRFWGIGQKQDSLSIVDRHGRRPRMHRAAISEVEQSISMIIQQLNG